MKIAFIVGSALLIAGSGAMAQQKMQSDMPMKNSAMPMKSGMMQSDAKDDMSKKKMSSRRMSHHMMHHKRHHKMHHAMAKKNKSTMMNGDMKVDDMKK